MPQAADNFSRLQSLMVILMNTSKFKSRNLKLLKKKIYIWMHAFYFA